MRDWLPSVIQSIKPYVSSEDIDKGARWSSDIAGELDASSYGILCLTNDNVNAPWINFEAGALGKSVDKSRVSPFLFRVLRSDIEGPVLQFQSTILEKDDVYKLLRSINSACGEESLEEGRLERAYDVWWPKLLTDLERIPDEKKEADSKGQESEADVRVARVLEEILDLSRNNHKLLRDPTSLMPPEYVEHVLFRSKRRIDEIDPGAIEEVIVRYRDVLKCVSRMRSQDEFSPEMAELIELIERIDRPLRYISRHYGMRLPRDTFMDKSP